MEGLPFQIGGLMFMKCVYEGTRFKVDVRI